MSKSNGISTRLSPYQLINQPFESLIQEKYTDSNKRINFHRLIADFKSFTPEEKSCIINSATPINLRPLLPKPADPLLIKQVCQATLALRYPHLNKAIEDILEQLLGSNQSPCDLIEYTSCLEEACMCSPWFDAEHTECLEQLVQMQRLLPRGNSHGAQLLITHFFAQQAPEREALALALTAAHPDDRIRLLEELSIRCQLPQTSWQAALAQSTTHKFSGGESQYVAFDALNISQRTPSVLEQLNTIFEHLPEEIHPLFAQALEGNAPHRRMPIIQDIDALIGNKGGNLESLADHMEAPVKALLLALAACDFPEIDYHQIAENLHDCCFSCAECNHAIRLISTMPEERRLPMLLILARSLENSSSAFSTFDTLEDIAGILALPQGEAAFDTLTQWLKTGSCRIGLREIARSFALFPPTKRPQMLLNAMPYLDRTRPHTWGMVAYACTMSHGTALFRSPPTQVQDLAPAIKEKVQALLSFIPAHQQTEPLIQQMAQLLSSNNIQDIAAAAALVPREHRPNMFLTICATSLMSHHEEGETLGVLFASALPPDMLEEITAITRPTTQETMEELTCDPARRDRIHSWLMQLIHSESPLLPMDRWRIADMAIQFKDLLNIQDESPLYEAAYIEYLIWDPSQEVSAAQPYIHHRHLKRTLQDEPTIPYVPPAQEVDGHPLRINVSALRECQHLAEYTQADLDILLPASGPRQIAKRLKDLFNNLIARRNRLAGDEKQRLDEYLATKIPVQGQTSDHHRPRTTVDQYLQELKANLLQDPAILELCRELRVAPEAKVSSTKYWFWSIMRDLFQADGQLNDHPLSQQEEMLMAFSESVQLCATGKAQGIHNFFKSIHRISDSGTINEESPKGRLTTMLVEAIHTELDNAFDRPQLIAEAVGFPEHELEEESHDSLYLRNRFGRQCGLVAPLQFDPVSEFITKELLSKTPEEILPLFYRHFTPADLVRAVRTASKAVLQNYGAYHLFLEFIEAHRANTLSTDTVKEHFIFSPNWDDADIANLKEGTGNLSNSQVVRSLTGVLRKQHADKGLPFDSSEALELYVNKPLELTEKGAVAVLRQLGILENAQQQAVHA